MENKGFTLIELLLVGVIMGLFGTFVVMRFIGAQNASYDTKRMSDLKQYQIALESFAANHDGIYPSRIQSGGITVDYLCGDLSLTVCPDDRNAPSATYRYFTDGTGHGDLNATKYILWAKLEKPTVDTWFVVCSNGQSGETNLVPTTSSCPL